MDAAGVEAGALVGAQVEATGASPVEATDGVSAGRGGRGGRRRGGTGTDAALTAPVLSAAGDGVSPEPPPPKMKRRRAREKDTRRGDGGDGDLARARVLGGLEGRVRAGADGGGRGRRAERWGAGRHHGGHRRGLAAGVGSSVAPRRARGVEVEGGAEERACTTRTASRRGRAGALSRGGGAARALLGVWTSGHRCRAWRAGRVLGWPDGCAGALRDLHALRGAREHGLTSGSLRALLTGRRTAGGLRRAGSGRDEIGADEDGALEGGFASTRGRHVAARAEGWAGCGGTRGPEGAAPAPAAGGGVPEGEPGFF